MSPQPGRSRRNSIRILVFLAVFFICAVTAGVAFAAWTTIDLTQNTIDTTWGAPNYTEACDLPAAPRDDLMNAWYKYDGTKLYFRIQTCGSPALSNFDTRRAVAAIDCNSNGVFTDPYVDGPDGDRVVVLSLDPDQTMVYVYSGAGSDQPIAEVPGGVDAYDASGANLEWHVPLAWLYPACRGSTSSVNIAWSVIRGDETIVDQSETYAVHSNPMDFGDRFQTLPNPPNACSTPNAYTGLQCDGARHGFGPTPSDPLRLGSAALDPDPGNLVSANLDADDTSGTTPGDERGIEPDPVNLWNDDNGTLKFTIVGSGVPTIKMSCWVDFNQDGDWTDAGENILNNASINSTTTSRGVTLPTGKTFPATYPSRCRIWPSTLTATSAPGGPIEFGEVEDNLWEFDSTGRYVAPATPEAVTSLAISHPAAKPDVLLTWTHNAANQDYQVFQSTTNPYFAPASGTSLGVVSAAPWEYTHSGVYGSPAQTYYYNVVGRVSGGTVISGPSNRTGLFEFGLTAGQP